MTRRTPRTPEFDSTETSPAWGEVDKTFGAFVAAYADAPGDVEEWDDLSRSERRAIAARSLNGSVDADSFEDGVVLPVVNPATDDLSRPGLESAQRFTSRTEGIDSRATERKIDALLREHFDVEEDDSKFMSTTTPTGDASADGEFEKRVELLEKDDAEQIARGAVLVPDRLDHQGDFLRAETIADLRDSFKSRVQSGDAYPGVMHSVFPREDLELVEDRQLDAPETIGTKTLPAGTWVQGWKYTDDTLWQLVDDGVLSGFSIGGTAKGTVYDPGAMPDDVEIPTEVQTELDEAGLSRDDIRVREITQGRIMETSTVDRPAVPDAVHAEVKTDLAKASPALTENVVAARLYLEERGHEPNDARRLAEYLNERKARKGWLGRLREKWLGGGAQTSDERAESRTRQRNETPTDMDADELNEKLTALDERLERIDDQLSEQAADDGGEGEEKTSETDGPTTDEKLDQLADATTTVAEQVERVAEQVERMANAQGVSQQADTGSTADEGSEKTWDNSPFFAGGDD